MKEMLSTKISRMKHWYEVNERRVSIASLLFGFGLDSLTLQRIDALRENLWIGFNLLVVGFCILVLNKEDSRQSESASEEENARRVKRHFWLTTVMQFSFGAILGAFFIFYFRSAAVASAWPFLLVLLSAMLANELFQKRYARLALQLSFYYLAVFSFLIFLVPVLTKRIGAWMFVLSGLLSLVAMWLYAKLLRKYAKGRFQEGLPLVRRSVLGIFVTINLLYFTNVIPPIPLAMKDAGVYHSVSRYANGSYVVEAEERSLLDLLRLKPKVHYVSGGTVYAYSAIFSPTALNTNIIHEWQYKGEDGKWVTRSRIPLYVSGGRDAGFRTYSASSNLAPGSWRVNVATPRGQLIGRISFRAEASDTKPETTLLVKD